MGGLGNQLFQIAASLLLQKNTNSRLLFLIPQNLHDTTDYRTIFNLEKYDQNPPLYAHTFYQDDGFAYWNPNSLQFPIIHLYGYFQNYNVLKEILPEFKIYILNYIDEYKNYMLLQNTIKPNTGFIHIRRGDYLEKNDIHHISPIEYYKQGVQILNHIEHWIIFSDDIHWCKNQPFLINLNPIFITEERAIYSLALMTAIKDGAIISNSTFSWMGAFLGETKNVIYPQKWFNHKIPDLFPNNWIGI
jgi:hypothetical protein